MPMVWNTKGVWTISAALFLHLMFYTIGRFSFHSFHQLRNYYGFFNARENTQLFLIYLLIAFLFLVLWLLYYLRHNPFKSFFPVNKNYLFKEYFLVLISMVLLCSVYFSYTTGYKHSFLKYSKGINLEKDSRIVNTAAPFLPFIKEEFESNGSCDSIDAREKRQRILDSIAIAQSDTLEECDVTYEEVNYEEAVAIAEPVSDTVPYVEPVPVYSYLFYCGRKAYYDSLPDRYYINQARDWLKNNDKEKIKRAIADLKSICPTYEASYKINEEYWANLCFKDSLFTVTNTLNDWEYYSGVEDSELEMNFITQVMSEIDMMRREPFISYGALFTILYFALGITTMVFLFRLTGLKAWLIAIIGSIFWIILVSLISIQANSEIFFFYFILFLFALFFVTSFVLIRKKTWKTIGGVGFIWAMILLPSLLPIVMGLIYHHTTEITECINHRWQIVYPEPPIHGWIRENWELINGANIALKIGMMFTYIIPLAIRWQSNPEE